jgi:hypothetical protein
MDVALVPNKGRMDVALVPNKGRMDVALGMPNKGRMDASKGPHPCGPNLSLTNQLKPTPSKRKPGVRVLNSLPAFETFWNAYPKRWNKPAALREWVRLDPSDELVAQILAGLEKWTASDDWQKDNGRFRPPADRFLRDRRWEHPPEMEPPANGPPPHRPSPRVAL